MICFGSAVSEFPEPLCYHHHVVKKETTSPKPRNWGLPDEMPMLTLAIALTWCSMTSISFTPYFFFYIIHLAVSSCPLGIGNTSVAQMVLKFASTLQGFVWNNTEGRKYWWSTRRIHYRWGLIYGSLQTFWDFRLLFQFLLFLIMKLES